jgi:hypothetical protein
VLTEHDVQQLDSLTWQELHFIEPEPGEVHESEAGHRIALAAAGPGVEVGQLGGGHWPLVAVHRGLLRVSVPALTTINSIADVCVYTRLDAQAVDAGTVVARAKVSPLVVRADSVTAAERVARDAGGLVRVAAFVQATIGVVVQERLAGGAASRSMDALRDKLSWFGSEVLPPIFVAPDATAVAGAMANVAQAGATIIVLVGTRSLDPLDPAFLALDRLGARLDRYGVPVHPGSMFWLAHWGQRRILGLPTCGLFSDVTSFDVIVPRVLAGESIDAHMLSTLGHGGLL